MPDETDALVERWAEAVPQIDPRVERIVDRLLISAKYLERLAARLSAPHDLQLADYEILARLYWVGPPHRLRPSQLAAGTLAPATSVTSRLDRLQKRGMLHRVADPKDRRVLAAELTDTGRTLFEQIVAEQAEAERAIFDRLDTDQLSALDTGLRALMTVLDDQLGPAPRRVSLALEGDQAIRPPR
ncbi:MAG TPA: MarR family transcriptional regulator [Actinophytocola sp.]|nr:MarR family transcriptional regulator [Actinophytocola sp.]